jgi:hypothetical protein
MRRTRGSILLLSLAISACATVSFERNAVNVLSNAATVYENAMPVIGDLAKKGLLSDEERTAALQAGLIFWSAYHEAELALEVYHATKTAEAEAKLETALKALADRMGAFYEVLKPLLERARR